ncbi:MAG: InlB B-repeat-containing protein [Lachnospiraceae bacterium]|nr:InlB B-repeat-containing protein [Lachnospiraceae bacterium]
MGRFKKLTALLLMVAMVLSLIMTPSNIKYVNAAEELTIDILTGSTLGLKVGSRVSELSIKKMTIANNAIGYSNLSFSFNNGKYSLDPDDVVEAGTDYTMIITFDTSNASAFVGVTSAKIGIYGKTYDASMPDYLTGKVTVKDAEVKITATLKSYPKQISSEQIHRLAWNLVYNNAVDTTAIILDSKNAQFTASKISWYYSADKGKSRKSVSRIDATADGVTTYYIAEVKLIAKDGYCFREYTKEEINAWHSLSDEYKCTLGSNKKEITITVSGLIPTDGYNNQINSITELVFDTEAEFKLAAGKTYATASEILQYCTGIIHPNCFVGIKGETAIRFAELDASSYRSGWQLFKPDGSAYKLNDQISTSTPCYLAYPLGTIKSLMSNSRYNYVDNHNLFSIYQYDLFTNPDIPTAVKSKAPGYWVIKVDVLPEDGSFHPTYSYGYPTFTFSNGKFIVRNNLPNTALCAGITGKDGKTAASPFSTTLLTDGSTVSGNSIESTMIDGPMVYMAWSKRVGEGPISGPIVYKYYNPKEAESGTITGGSISFTIPNKPVAGQEVWKSYILYNRNATQEVITAANTEKIFYFWSGPSNSGFDYNNGVSKFLGRSSYSLKIYIPRRDGFYLNRTKAIFNIGGEIVESYLYPEENGKFFSANVFFTIMNQTGFISSSSVLKKMYFKNFEAPVSGATVQKNYALTDSSARFATVVQTKWYEDGKEFNGASFVAGKHYEVEIRLNCSKGWIESPNASIQQLVGDTKYCVSAIATSTDQTMVIRYSFGVCPTKKVKSIGDVIINIDNGVSAEVFKNKINAEQRVVVTFTDGTKESVVVKPTFMPSSSQQYSTFYDQFVAQFPGDKGYNPNNTEAQTFSMYGNVDLTKFGGEARNLVLVTIKVGEGTVTVTFDANGGTYLGEKTMKVKKNGAYGFGYDPAKIYREGYFFAGWYLDNGTNYDAYNRVWADSICKGNVTLYAHWLKTFTGICWDVSAKSYSKGTITYKWDNIKTLYNGFETIISTDGKKWSNPEDVGKIKIRTFMDLNSNKNYYLRVRAYRYDSTGLRVYGNWSKVVKVKVK